MEYLNQVLYGNEKVTMMSTMHLREITFHYNCNFN